MEDLADRHLYNIENVRFSRFAKKKCVAVPVIKAKSNPFYACLNIEKFQCSEGRLPFRSERRYWQTPYIGWHCCSPVIWTTVGWGLTSTEDIS